jgi:hypothetical protein
MEVETVEGGPADPPARVAYRKPGVTGMEARQGVADDSGEGWLIEQRYVLANPFAGIKVRGARQTTLDTTRSFSEGDWKLVRTVAEGLEGRTVGSRAPPKGFAS